MRTLWRDAQIIGQDIVRGAFTPPAAPLIIGRRYDNMSGLTGSIQQLDIVNRVLTQADLTTFDTVTDLQKISGLVYDTQLQSIAPNKSTTRCGSNGITCPIWGTATIQEPSHDGAMAIFEGTQRLQIDKPATPNGFSIGYWARSIRADYGQTIVSHLNSDGTGMRMGNYYAYDYFTDTYNFVTGCTWTTMQYDEPGTFAITNPIDDQNLWHHYLCSFDATNGLLAYYVDGVLMTQYDGVYIQTVTAPVVVGYTPAGFPNFDEGYYTGWLDDLMIYDSAVSETGVAYIYNSTNPPALREIPAPPPCDIPEGCPQPAATLTFTATPTASLTPMVANSKTPLPATATARMPGITPYTVTRTLTRTATTTRSPSTTRTSTASLTPTLPSATPYLSPTRTATRTRTPLGPTQTMLARRSPTSYAQTLTATALMQYNQTQTAIALTTTAGVATATKPATAYPLPATGTSTRTAYPIPASKTRTATRTATATATAIPAP
jgi:hypothetical protein